MLLFYFPCCAVVSSIKGQRVIVATAVFPEERRLVPAMQRGEEV